MTVPPACGSETRRRGIIAHDDFHDPKTDPIMPSPPAAFRRALGLYDATMLVVGSMIGSGIFIVSADIARTVGSAGWLLVVWLLSGLMTVAVALSYGELAAMMPRAGGQYVYLREAWNPLVGFLYGWTLFLVIQTGTIAAVAVAFAKFTAVLLPVLGESTVLCRAGFVTLTAQRLVAMMSILILTGVNMRGIVSGKIIQNVFTTAKWLSLLALIVLGIAAGLSLEAFVTNLKGFWDAASTHVTNTGLVREPLTGLALVGALGVAMVGSLFSSDAWNNVTFTAGETVNPKRTIPLSLAIGTGAVVLLYFLSNVSYLAVLPLQGDPHAGDVAGRGIQFTADDRVATAAMSVVLGPVGVTIMAVLIMISTFGCNNGLILSGARVYYAMAQDGLLFRKVGVLTKRSVPGVALALQAGWACFLCVSGTYSDLLDYVVFAVLLFYVLTVAGIFLLRRRLPNAERSVRAAGYPVVPLLYIAAAATVACILLVLKPAYTWPGMIIVALGVPVYFLWHKGQPSADPPSHG